MLNGVNDGVSFEDNTITTLTTPVRNCGVPHEKSVTNEFLELNASVTKKIIGIQLENIILFLKIVFQEYIFDITYNTYSFILPLNLC